MSTLNSAPPKSWAARYRERHQLTRITGSTLGVTLPKRVRIYRRREHFVLQWWDRVQRRTLNERVDGDLVEAIGKARTISERLAAFNTSGASKRITLLDVIDKFSIDLTERADAGEIAPGTPRRYLSALHHLREFVVQPLIQRDFRLASRVNRKFRLLFAAFLQRPTTKRKRNIDSQFIFDTCRALFEWAADCQRGNLIGEGFSNPFCDRHGGATAVRPMALGEPDVTVDMACEYLARCDFFQLRLFATILLCGLRPSEITYLMSENRDTCWLQVECLPEISYFSKGRRDKRFPCVEPLDGLLGSSPHGLLFTRRGHESTLPLQGLAKEFAYRLTKLQSPSAAKREQVRDQLLREQGCLDYDRIEGEFHSVAAKLNWPRSATIKDFRHLFCTCLENAGMPEYYRRFLMGQSPGRAAIVGYTHLNKLREHYVAALRSELSPIVATIEERLKSLDGASACRRSVAPRTSLLSANQAIE